MNEAQQLSMAIAFSTPDKKLYEAVMEAINKYNQDPSDANKNQITIYCKLICEKELIKQYGGLQKALEYVEGANKIEKLFDHTKNNS